MGAMIAAIINRGSQGERWAGVRDGDQVNKKATTVSAEALGEGR